MNTQQTNNTQTTNEQSIQPQNEIKRSRHIYKFVKNSETKYEDLLDLDIVKLRLRLDAGETLTREELEYIDNNISDNSPVKLILGWRIDFYDVFKKYFAEISLTELRTEDFDHLNSTQTVWAVNKFKAIQRIEQSYDLEEYDLYIVLHELKTDTDYSEYPNSHQLKDLLNVLIDNNLPDDRQLFKNEIINFIKEKNITKEQLENFQNENNWGNVSNIPIVKGAHLCAMWLNENWKVNKPNIVATENHYCEFLEILWDYITYILGEEEFVMFLEDLYHSIN